MSDFTLSPAIYAEPLFFWFPVMATLVSMGAFALFAGVLTAIARADPPGLRRWRIQSRKPREGVIGPSIRSWLINNGVLFVLVAASWPLVRLSGIHLGPLPPLWVIAAQLLLFVYLDDFLYYWFHRAMHTRWLFRRVHAWHHRIYTPWAITGNYMHPVEFVITGTLALVGPILLGSHVVVVWLWAAFRQWEAAEGHCGYAFPWSPTHWLPGSDGALHHDFHHSKVRGNYAGFLPIWDRFFGTQVSGYTDSLRAFRDRGESPQSG